MTIDDLIKRLDDKKFAKKFKILAARCCRDRDNLEKKGVSDRAAARRFLASWGQFFETFADDPASLASLMAPNTGGTYSCDTNIKMLTPFTGTQTTQLYKAAKPTRGKTAAGSTTKSGTTKRPSKKK